ncbi:hypothetical protein EON63_05615, partial [archaeon]
MYVGLYYPYNTDKGFPYVTIISKDDVVMPDIKEGETKQKTFTSHNILKDKKGVENRWGEYRGKENYCHAREYLEKLHEREMKKQVKEAGKGTKKERVRRGGKRGVEITPHLTQAKLLTLAPLAFPKPHPQSPSS